MSNFLSGLFYHFYMLLLMAYIALKIVGIKEIKIGKPIKDEKNVRFSLYKEIKPYYLIVLAVIFRILNIAINSWSV